MVLTLGAQAPLTPSTTPVQPPPARSLRDVVRLRPGWPVVLLFVGYPLWWAFGITYPVGLVAACAMAVALVRRPRVRVPPGFGILLLFLVWIGLTFLVIQVAAPGAVPVANSRRYLTASWRLLWYLQATVLLLYLGNERERLRQAWICRTLGWMFCYVVAGGLLGVIAPGFEFRSLAELVLPHGLTTTQFVYANIHPVAAERFADFLGGAHRTSAPFPYTNVWGLNLACFLPFFVAGWLSREAGRRRRMIGWVVLGLSVVPIVLSLNRGLWLALAIAAVLLAIRAAIGGQLRLIAVLGAGVVIVATVLAVSPLGASVEHRLSGDGINSAHTRSQLTSLTLSGVRDKSPLLGFGATRDVQGSFTSIAGGATTSCRRCSPPALGTQGQLQLETFTHGLIGAVLYFGFLLMQFARHLTTRSKYATAGLAVLAAHFATSAVYSADNLAILAIFAAVAMLWRASAAQRIGDASGERFAPDEGELAAYPTALLRHSKPALAVILAAVIAGTALAVRTGPAYRATASVWVPDEPRYLDPALAPLPASLDSIARGASSHYSTAAMRRAAGPGRSVQLNRLTVLATPNSRVLHVTYASADPRLARALASAVAAAMLRLHARALWAEKQRMIAALTARRDAIAAAIADVRIAAERAGQPLAVRTEVAALTALLRDTGVQLAAAEHAVIEPGHDLRPPSVAVSRDRQLLDAANALALGVLAVAGLLLLAGLRSPRVGAASGAVTGIPLIWRGPLSAGDVHDLVHRYPAGTALAVGTDRHALEVAAHLDAAIAPGDRGLRQVILVAAVGDRVRDVRRARARLANLSVIGVVAVRPSPVGRRHCD